MAEDFDMLADMEVADILIEMPQPFSVGGRRFNLYPVSLGKSFFLSRLTGKMGIDYDGLRRNPYAESLRLVSADKKGVCRIIACHTVNSREKLFDTARIDEAANFLAKNLSEEEAARIFTLTASEMPMEGIYKRLGIEADTRRRQRVMAAKKKDGNTYTFGGNSIFGSLIAPACEKLHMTPRQVVWGISLRFLKLLLADSITQVYLTDEERKRCRVSNDNERINADDPRNIERIKQMNWD